MTEGSNSFNFKHSLIIVTAACLVIFIGFGTRSTMGVFLVPITDHYDWGRSIFAFAAALQNIFWGLSQPIFGAIADRYGSGRVIIVGGLCYVAGLALMTVSTTPLGLYLSNGMLIGFGLSGTTFAIVLAVIARSVSEKHRSMALGVGAAAGSLGQFILVPFASVLISNYGWMWSILVFASIAFLILPLSFTLKGKPQVSGPSKP